MYDDHCPLHLLEEGEVTTAGRALVSAENEKSLANAHRTIPVETDREWPDGSLVRVTGRFDGRALHLATVEVVEDGRRSRLSSRPRTAEAIRERAKLNRIVRDFFEERDFLEVETQALVPSPGTDVHIDPLSVELRSHPSASTSTTAYLHTSPEFAMKRLLVAGFERIYQLGKVWRNGEVTRHHNPEFTMLEWYRAWSGVDAIVDDVEEFVRAALPETFCAHGPHGRVDVRLDRPIPRMTMQEVVEESCGFDVLECLEVDELREAIASRRLFRVREEETSWADLFSELQVAVIDPWVARKRALFVTHWPSPVAVLARRDPEDPRRSERFELYLGGIEIANGFGELTDHEEQRRRFRAEDRERFDRRLPRLPLPELFLEALRVGMPPSGGVALGVDRLLMLRMEAETIDEVAPFAIRSDAMGRWVFG